MDRYHPLLLVLVPPENHIWPLSSIFTHFIQGTPGQELEHIYLVKDVRSHSQHKRTCCSYASPEANGTVESAYQKWAVKEVTLFFKKFNNDAP